MIILGSTGSIGKNTLEIARRFELNVDVLVAGKNIELLNKQIEEFSPRVVVVSSKDELHKVNHSNVLCEQEGILEAIQGAKGSLVVNALVGFLGLKPTLKAIECGKKVALANKESLVAGGAFIDISKIQPIDSEHFGLWYLLNKTRKTKKMVITASGGAFRDWDISNLKNATLEDALKHPNWSMGQKITIDSASMVNKIFELLEARWLFGEGEYDAVIETKSLIHALIDFKDGSTTAHFAHADMKLPIAYAIMGEVQEQILRPINLTQIGSLEFREITKERYPVWEIKEDLLRYPKKGAIVNSANEAAIELFIEKKCSFLDISKKIIEAYNRFNIEVQSLDELFILDKEVRAYVKQS